MIASWILTLNDRADVWFDALVRASWQGALVLLLAWGISRTLPWLPARLRCWWWRIAFLKLLLTFVWATPIHLPVLPPPSPSPEPVSAAASAPVPSPVLIAPTDSQDPFPLSSSVARMMLPSAAGGLLLLWLLGIGVSVARIWRECHEIARLRRRCVPLEDEDWLNDCAALCGRLNIRRPPRLLVVSDSESPLLAGVRRPVIILPEALLARCAPLERQMVLAHELAHLKRADLLWSWLPALALGLFPFHPLVWLGLREWRLAQEMACDEVAVLATGTAPDRYAELLVRVTAQLTPRGQGDLVAIGVMESYHTLRRRLAAMRFIHPISRRRWFRAAAVLAASGAAILIPWRVVARGAPDSGSATAAGKAGHGLVAGHVLTPDGQPVGGARVSWVSRHDREALAHAAAETDAAGRFRFEDTAALRQKGEYPKLLVEAAGWGLTAESVPEGNEAMEIRLNRPNELRVTFLDSAGRPVPALKVVAHFLSREPPPGSFFHIPQNALDRFTQETDGTGTALFPNLPQGYRVRLRHLDDRFSQVAFEDDIRLVRDPVTQAKPIRLLAGASVEGRITHGPTRKPAAGIRIGAQGVGVENGWGEAVTDAGGRYRMSQLRPGTYNLALDLKGELARDWTARAHERVSVTQGARLNGYDFQLIHGAVLTGKVVAADNGEPVADVHIGVYGPAHPLSSAWVQGVVTGPDGTYLHRVPEGDQHLYFMMGTPPPGFLMPARKTHDLKVKNGETVTIDFPLPRGVRVKPVRGRVLLPDGKPAAGAEVLATGNQRFDGRGTVLKADAGGRFTLEEKHLATAVTLRARQGDLATPTGTIVTGGEDVTLRLQKDAFVSLTGRVTDAAGKPIAGAEVSLIQWAYDAGHGSGTATADRDGRYAFASLWPDLHYSVLATAQGYGRNSSARLGLRPGETREVASLALKQAGRTLTGRVVDANGDPVVGVQVNLSGRETFSQRPASTDHEGRFRFENVVNEKLRITVNPAGNQWIDKNVPEGSSEVIIVVPGQGEKASADARPKEEFEKLLGREAPPLQAVAWVNSSPRTMRQLRGKVVLIDFWGIGCGPCVASLPGVQHAAEQFKSKGVVVIGLHDSGTTPAKLQEFARKHKLTYPLAIDARDAQRLSFGKTFRQYTVQGIPAVAVIDRQGKVAYLGNSLEEAVGALGPLLGPSPRPGLN